MRKYQLLIGGIIILIALAGCTGVQPTGPEQTEVKGLAALDGETASLTRMGAIVANGWYEGEEIYYIDGGIEEGVTERGQNQIYLIGGDRAYQAQVVLFIPREAGYSPHWNVNVVHTASGVTVADILASPWASAHYPEALFDDVEDILGAEASGMVTIDHPGVVVLCPVVAEQASEAPGNTELPEEFPPFPDTF